MILTEFHKDLLKRIKAGEKNFTPSGAAENKLEMFQTEAAALIELEQTGLITLQATHRESPPARQFYNLIVVGQLTQNGRSGFATKKF